jgi:HD-GYP domain-containing protein (c-di-GMP phosphodiesterase class II)
MPLQLNHRGPRAASEPFGVPPAALDNLAARFRPDGLFICLLRPDGSVRYSDPSGSPFFTRYLLSLLADGRYSELSLPTHLRKPAPEDAITVFDRLPGLILAMFPIVDRRRHRGFVVLAGKSQDFTNSEEVQRACGRLSIDTTWLTQQAKVLPGFDSQSILRHCRLLNSTVLDQLRLNGLQGELDSLSGQLADTYEELSLIYQVSGGMKINRRPGEFFKEVCVDLLEVMGVGGVGVALAGNHSQRQAPAIYGSISLPNEILARISQEIPSLLATQKTPILINNLAEHPAFNWLAEYAQQILAVPMQREDATLGCLFALEKSIGEFDSQDAKLLFSLANESAIYLENAILYDDVHGLMMGLLHSLTSAVDAKDSYTCGHSERVALLARELSDVIGLSEELSDRIYMAGLLHDVGKIGVPEAVLQKTGKLTVEEFDQMKKHPAIGARILKDVPQISDLIPGVLHHHERFDGRGYPAKLSGHDIPLMGRIICLADCFDAMTSNRTYRQALPLEVALLEIRRAAGTQFDPELADSFLKIGAARFRELLQAHLEPVSHGELPT